MTATCRECNSERGFLVYIVYGYRIGEDVEQFPYVMIHERHLIGVEVDEQGSSTLTIVDPAAEKTNRYIPIREEWLAENCPRTYDAIMNRREDWG